ncbi:MAG TPA: enoyl-CoA hydratase-related protein [Urbifossiella sp.]|nr:enoyl-CoA hydratase-related protein [Urbifossiella sp.]
MSDPAVRVAVRPDRVAVLTIDQPGAKVNVLTVPLWDELEAALDALPPDLTGLVIASGKPGCFIAGADLNLLANATPGDPAVKAFIEEGLRVLAKLEAPPFPTCAAIDGVALGGGLELALACDYRMTGLNEKIRLGLPEVMLGLIPGWGGTQRLPRIVGIRAALGMLLSGVPLEMHDAARAGLIDGGWLSETLIDACVKLMEARPLSRDSKLGPVLRLDSVQEVESESRAAEEVNRVVRAGAGRCLRDAIPIETEAFLRLAGSDESRAKIAAFFAGRKR